MDHTSIHPHSKNQAHHIDLHLWRGAPQNTDASRPVQILVNQGYVVGFCPDRLQPLWSAYRVAYADQDVDYDRPLLYYDDMRLDENLRVGPKTFGKIGGIQLHVGHMSPNEVINRQFGRLAQMETFLMSNMSPQYGSLNSGVWLKLEDAIRDIEDEPKKKDHVWIIVGPIFGEEPVSIGRGSGKNLPVPEAYFCISVDPHSYPYNTMSRVHLDCFIIPQTAPSNTFPQDYPATLEEIEERTKLKFFEGYGREVSLNSSLSASNGEVQSESRLMQILAANKQEYKESRSEYEKERQKAKSIDDLLELLKSEALEVGNLGSSLTQKEIVRLEVIQHTISHLLQVKGFAQTKSVKTKEAPLKLITYKIVSDSGDKLKIGARTACNFWNRFILPKYSIVIRLGTFTQFGNTIARAYKPYEKDGVKYGKVEFNTKFLGSFSDEDIAGTIIHEIGHSLGIGWSEWLKLFDADTGIFTANAVKKIEALNKMEIELEGGPGTALAHWDEDRFDKEIMTGFKDTGGEHVLPVTIDVMELLGHRVVERLDRQMELGVLLEDAVSVIFSRQDEISEIDLEHFEETEIMETIPHED